MSQFFMRTTNSNADNQNNKADPGKLPLTSPLIRTNMFFSPASEKDFSMNNMFFQVQNSPAVSYNQFISPGLPGSILGNNDFGTPLVLDNLSQFFSSNEVYNEEANNNSKFKLPLKIENLAPDNRMSGELKQEKSNNGFQPFMHSQSNNLKRFLQDQIQTNNFSIQSKESDVSEEAKKSSMKTENQSKNKTPNERMSNDSETSKREDSTDDKKILSISVDGIFHDFNIILTNVFFDGSISQEVFDSLNPFQRELLFYVVKRKYLPKSFKNSSECNETPTYESLCEILKTKNNKRPEECYKFVLTRVIKYLKHMFETNAKKKLSIEQCLYEFYFKETSEQLKVPLKDFHYPLTGSLKGTFKLNSAYFSKIFKSEKFVEAIRNFCSNNIIPEYRIDIQKKLKSLLDRWTDVMIRDYANKDGSQNQILDYVKYNKRCKLPWSIDEVKESMDKFLNLIQYYQNKSSKNSDKIA